MTDDTDRIRKQARLNASRERVWQAISDSKQFGTWFGVELDDPFVAGTTVSGRIAPTRVDPVVARTQEPYAGMACDFLVERVEPMRLFSFRWHPGVPEADVDDSNDPTTLVVFELEDVGDGTLLTITESGFDQLPPARRAAAFASNESGWQAQLQLIAKYLAQTP